MAKMMLYRFLLTAFFWSLAQAAGTFIEDYSYNKTYGLENPAAWGSMGITAGTNKSIGQPDAALGTPLQWLLTVDSEGKETISIAAPQGNITSTNSTSIFQTSSNYSSGIYGACLLEIPLTINTVQNAQQDDGSCSSALSLSCIDQILETAHVSANDGGWPGSQGPCANVAKQITTGLADGFGGCGAYFVGMNFTGYNVSNITLDSDGVSNWFNNSSPALPGYGVLPLWSGTEDFGLLGSQNTKGPGNSTTYNNSFRTVKALLLAFWPPNGGSSYATYLNCVKINNHTGSAFVPPALPSGTAVSAPDRSDEQAERQNIAGAVGGTLAGLIVVGSSFFFIRRHRRKVQADRLRLKDLEQRLAETTKKTSWEVMPGPEGGKAMLDSQEIVLRELDASEMEPQEMQNNVRAEMEGCGVQKELEAPGRTELPGTEAGKEMEADDRSLTMVESVVSPMTDRPGESVGDISPEEREDGGDLPVELPGDTLFDPEKSATPGKS